MSIELIQNLLKTPSFNNAKLIETHISWVLLTGDTVYKIKKPVDFEFLNYSTLEKRKFYCEEEIRLNSALAPNLYLEVVTINGDINHPEINGNGAVLDYAVKMREFAQENLFARLLEKNQLTTKLIQDLAQQVAEFHLKTPVAATDTILGTPEHVQAPVIQNFDQILPLLNTEEDREQLNYLRNWSEHQYEIHHSLLQQRKYNGFIRECHGDLHLGNIILYQQKPVLFDCIEFNVDFRWTDTIADIAFLAMDLDDHSEPLLARQLLNSYFQATGDYQGIALLPYYQAYRAIVRAKVALFGLAHGQHSAEQQAAILTQYRNLMALAIRYTQSNEIKLYIMHGYTGSGKSTVAKQLLQKFPAFIVRSDIERKRLVGLTADSKTNSGINAGIYAGLLTEQTYLHLRNCAHDILAGGYSAIVDAAFMQKNQRDLFLNLADECYVPFVILHCNPSRELIEHAITERSKLNQDPSEGDIAVLEMQEQTVEPLTENEKEFTEVIDVININKTIQS